MSHIDICFICLKHSNNLILFTSQDNKGISFENKLQCFLPGLELNSNIPKYVCGKCQRDLSKMYKFKEKCLKNITTYEKSAQQIATKDGYEYFIFLRPSVDEEAMISNENHYDTILEAQSETINTEDFIFKEEFRQENCELVDTSNKNGNIEENVQLPTVNEQMRLDENNYDTNISEPQGGIVLDIIDCEETIIQEQKNDEIEAQNEMNNTEEFIIKEEFKEGNYESVDTCNKNKNIRENVEISLPTENEQTRIDENNHDANVAESQEGIVLDIVNCEDVIIQEQTNEEYILEDEIELLMRMIKQNESIIEQNNENISKQIEKEQYECYVCQKTYPTKVELENHILSHSQNENIEVLHDSVSPLTELKNISDQSNKEYKCGKCVKKFNNAEDIKKHKLSCNDIKLFECKICDKSFKYINNFKNHQKIHKSERPTCEFCQKDFKDLYQLKSHLLSHSSEKTYKCEICDKSYKHSKTLRQHELLHTEHPNTCEICNKSFLRASSLRQHKLIHTGEKPHTCEICDKSFRQRASLNRHKLRHTGERAFTCEVCKNTFRRKYDLGMHKLIHTGEKPFTCEVCKKSFRRPDTLMKHKLRHTGEKPYTCEVCDKSFRELSTLRQHKLLHTDERPFNCAVCNKSYRCMKNLKIHSKIHSTFKSKCKESGEIFPALKKHLLDLQGTSPNSKE